MCESSNTGRSTVSWASIDSRRSSRAAGHEGWPEPAACALLEADPNPRASRREVAHRSDRRSGGNLSARGATSGLALSRRRARSGAERRAAAQAAKYSRRETGSGDRRDGVWAAAGRDGALDCRANDEGSAATRNRRQSRSGNDPASPREPRAEAVAGKKCGASQGSIASTSSAWRTCWTC